MQRGAMTDATKRTCPALADASPVPSLPSVEASSTNRPCLWWFGAGRIKNKATGVFPPLCTPLL